jgi:hypothetical protein
MYAGIYNPDLQWGSPRKSLSRHHLTGLATKDGDGQIVPLSPKAVSAAGGVSDCQNDRPANHIDEKGGGL